MDDDPADASFRAAIGDVAPLKSPSRNRSRGPRKPTAAQLLRRQNAAAEAVAIEPETLTLGEVPAVAPHDIIGWKNNGVQDGVYRSLRLGKYALEGSLDLHRKTVKEARAALLEFVRLAQAKGWRSVLVSHGRGERSPTPARIKSYAAQWLKSLPEVLAYHSAQPRHGGAGSVYVLLRKNVAAREENRERHGQKGS